MSSRNLPASAFPALGLQLPITISRFLWAQEVEIGSSCFNDEHYTHWAITLGRTKLIFPSQETEYVQYDFPQTSNKPVLVPQYTIWVIE